MNRFQSIFLGFSIILLLSLPISRAFIESTMVGTMLVQFPLLLFGGYHIGKGLPEKSQKLIQHYNENGLAGILLTVFIVGYWCLPRSIDAALNAPLMEFAKYTSLSFLAGISLYHSWRSLGPISKAFIWTNGLSMIFVMSWLYWVSPVRLCNNYLVTAQQQLGKSLFAVGLFISICIVVRPFIGKQNPNVRFFSQELNN
ncbi:hypothetical protein ACLM5H_01630 [Fredinandcohnia humi]